MSALATILAPGALTLIQDAGRIGARHLGVPQAGAADRLSLAIANCALGNLWDAAALECALTGPALRFEEDTLFAIAGADMGAALNETPISLYDPYEAKAGDMLTLKNARAGLRAYIAFAGGLDGEQFLQSRATYAPAHLGGVEGRALSIGDTVSRLGDPGAERFALPADMRPRFAKGVVLRAVLGPEAQLFGRKCVAKFFSEPFRLDARGNRMGVELSGPKITPPEDFSMMSSPVFPGTVQCPPSGAPFLLGPDAQTTGGYARIAQVIDADLPLAGQLQPRDEVWFAQNSPEKARIAAAKKTALYSAYLPGFFF